MQCQLRAWQRWLKPTTPAQQSPGGLPCPTCSQPCPCHLHQTLSGFVGLRWFQHQIQQWSHKATAPSGHLKTGHSVPAAPDVPPWPRSRTGQRPLSAACRLRPRPGNDLSSLRQRAPRASLHHGLWGPAHTLSARQQPSHTAPTCQRPRLGDAVPTENASSPSDASQARERSWGLHGVCPHTDARSAAHGQGPSCEGRTATLRGAGRVTPSRDPSLPPSAQTAN